MKRQTESGYDFWEVSSAFQKSIRRGLTDDALFWAVELSLSGYENYLWKRMFVIVSEDIGPAEPNLPATIDALYRSYLSGWGGRLALVHAILLLCQARKSRIVDNALIVHYRKHHQKSKGKRIPDWALDKHTSAGKRMNRGFEHFFAEGAKLANKTERYDDPYDAEVYEAITQYDDPTETPRFKALNKNATASKTPTPASLFDAANRAAEQAGEPHSE